MTDVANDSMTFNDDDAVIMLFSRSFSVVFFGGGESKREKGGRRTGGHSCAENVLAGCVSVLTPEFNFFFLHKNQSSDFMWKSRIFLPSIQYVLLCSSDPREEVL